MARKQNEQPASASIAPGPQTTTIAGFQIGIIAFIPIDPADLRKQAEVPLILLDIQEGKKSLADLAPYLKQVEFRQQHVRKRVPLDEARNLFSAPAEQEADPETGDEDETADNAADEDNGD